MRKDVIHHDPLSANEAHRAIHISVIISADAGEDSTE